jgi:hypothetical protein
MYVWLKEFSVSLVALTSLFREDKHQLPSRARVQISCHAERLIISWWPAIFRCCSYFKFYYLLFCPINGSLSEFVMFVDSPNKWMMHGWDVESNLKNSRICCKLCFRVSFSNIHMLYSLDHVFCIGTQLIWYMMLLYCGSCAQIIVGGNI